MHLGFCIFSDAMFQLSSTNMICFAKSYQLHEKPACIYATLLPIGMQEYVKSYHGVLVGIKQTEFFGLLWGKHHGYKTLLKIG